MNYSARNYSSAKRGFPAGNPIANALVIVVGALVIGASIVLGFFAFVILASLFILFSAIVGIRLWWFSRRLRKSMNPDAAAGGGARPHAGVIEGECHVVIEEHAERRPDKS